MTLFTLTCEAKKPATALMVSMGVILGTQVASAASIEEYEAVKEGYKIAVCSFADPDYDENYKEEFDFCSPTAIKQYKKFSKNSINFNKKYALIRINKVHMAAIDPVKKEVYPFPWKVVGEVTFKKDSDTVCTFKQGDGWESYTGLFFSEYATQDTKLCEKFEDGKPDFYKGFNIGVIHHIDKKSGKPIPRL